MERSRIASSISWPVSLEGKTGQVVPFDPLKLVKTAIKSTILILSIALVLAIIATMTRGPATVEMFAFYYGANLGWAILIWIPYEIIRRKFMTK